MSPSASDAPRYVVLGNPDGNRVAAFQQALVRRGLPPAAVVAWADYLDGRLELGRVVPRGATVRIESPGRDWPVEQRLLALGAMQEDEEDGFARLSASECATLTFEKGRLLYPRQWYLGFRAALRRVEEQLRNAPPHRRMNSPGDIAVMFDKRLCHQRLASAGIPVAPSLGPVRSFADLTARMRDVGCRAAFVKLAHGSSASGVVAYRTDGRRHEAWTTVEVVDQTGEQRLYNSRRVRVSRDEQEIAGLIDALGRHAIHAETWMPKAGMAGKAFDLRVVVVGGRPCHAVARLSRTPMTNLHLLNERRDASRAQAHMGEDAWEAALRTCAEAMTLCFPDSLYAGLDLLVTPGFRRWAVLEVNAFGDLLPGTLWQDMDTYEAELAAHV